jgi:hypothetical protein
VRHGEVGLGELFEHDLFDSPFVRRVEVRVQEAHRHRLYTGLPQLTDPLANLVLVERNEHHTARSSDPLLHGQPVSSLDKGVCLPGQLAMQGEVIGTLVTCDVEDVAEALRRDQAHLGAGMGEDDVRCDGRSVQDAVELSEGYTGALAQISNAGDGPPSRVVRRRGHLFDRDPPGLLVDQDQVGERAADVDADPLHAGTACAIRSR